MTPRNQQTTFMLIEKGQTPSIPIVNRVVGSELSGPMKAQTKGSVPGFTASGLRRTASTFETIRQRTLLESLWQKWKRSELVVSVRSVALQNSFVLTTVMLLSAFEGCFVMGATKVSDSFKMTPRGLGRQRSTSHIFEATYEEV